MHDSGTLLPRDRAVERAATPEEFREILARVRRGLDEGALGIGMGIAYLPHESRAEVLRSVPPGGGAQGSAFRPHAQWRADRARRDRRAAGDDRGRGGDGRVACTWSTSPAWGCARRRCAWR